MNRNKGKSPKLELKLNLSAPRQRGRGMEVEGSPSRRSSSSSPSLSSSSSSPMNSPPRSCVSSESERGSSPEAAAMVLAGCPRCLMYVMLSQKDPKCPKCKSTVLVDFVQDNVTNKKNKKR